MTPEAQAADRAGARSVAEAIFYGMESDETPEAFKVRAAAAIAAALSDARAEGERKAKADCACMYCRGDE